ncbi:MAG: histidine kinase [Thermoleophilia bacterium]
MPLFWRVYIPGAAVLVAAALALILLPIRVSSRAVPAEIAVVVAGLAALLAVSIVLVRRSLAPVRELTALARRTERLLPGERLPVPSGGDVFEVAELVETLNQMIARLEEERAESSRRSLLAQEAERLRIAHELHDEVGQTLTAVLLQLKRASERAPEELRGDVRGAQEAARAGLDELKRVVRQLRPEALDDLGLPSALTALSAAVTRQSGCEVAREIDHGLPELTPEAELVIYRVAQESLTNVVRHSGARRARLSLRPAGGGVAMRVADDGRGMGPGDEDSGGGGIRGMRERAMLVNGTLRLGPAPEGGVEVLLTVPAGAP